jgi:alkylation response protein AidB-like acyl-CoA dehydrogenase
VHARGFAVPSWPHSLGGLGLTLGQSKLIQVEFAKVGAAGAGVDRTNIAANILLKCGTQAARAELLDRFVTAELPICLLYSEPGAGSDLAAVRTRADRNGDDYVISGQKIWTSGARDAAFGLLLARTDWNVPKHAGLSFFFLSMRQPGIDTRPIHQINGDSNFNEVFIDGTHVPARYLVSNEGDCWKVIHAALGYERLIMG